MKEVRWGTKIEKAEYIFSREFCMQDHNYLCGCCKENSAVANVTEGVLMPCRECQKRWKLIDLSKCNRLFKWVFKEQR